MSKSVPKGRIFCFGLAMAFAAFSPLAASAHGTDLALQNMSGPYTVDMHYPFPFKAEVPIWLNFFLSAAGNSDQQEYFRDLDLTVLQGDNIILKTNIYRKIGIGTGAVLTFPKAGNYRIHLEFNGYAGKLTESYFDIFVPGDSVGRILGLAAADLGIGTALGSLATVAFVRFRLSKPRRS